MVLHILFLRTLAKLENNFADYSQLEQKNYISYYILHTCVLCVQHILARNVQKNNWGDKFSQPLTLAELKNQTTKSKMFVTYVFKETIAINTQPNSTFL